MTNLQFWRSLIAANRAGERRGIPSWCTAQRETLSAILAAHRDSDGPILIEATCNQVNHEGGYTGMRPADFRRFVEGLAKAEDIDPARLILGGDHLGPNPWKSLPAAEAMSRARDMVQSFVEAGFTKIHLDASMACADDRALSEETIAERAASLCAVAESAGRDLVYVIGTEVPIPGGELQNLDALAVTRPEAARRTYELHQKAFAAAGVGDALARVIALVVQPGVDMGNTQVFAFDPGKATSLSLALDDLPGLIYEAHSTDFQSEKALRLLVGMHFPILKVGPSLTFAFREAALGLSEIERRLPDVLRSGVPEALEQAMQDDPRHWRPYCEAGPDQNHLRLYGLSDRVRYYWPTPGVQSALRHLFANIDGGKPLPGLVSQYLGATLLDRSEPTLSKRAIAAKVGGVVGRYRRAAGT
jgi:D-tagatose-1,6-bisphosphate aldolase subunit GatZ/KbaZ